MMPHWRVEPTIELNREIAHGLYDVVSIDVDLATSQQPRSFERFVREELGSP